MVDIWLFVGLAHFDSLLPVIPHRNTYIFYKNFTTILSNQCFSNRTDKNVHNDFIWITIACQVHTDCWLIISSSSCKCELHSKVYASAEVGCIKHLLHHRRLFQNEESFIYSQEMQLKFKAFWRTQLMYPLQPSLTHNSLLTNRNSSTETEQQWWKTKHLEAKFILKCF